jgi:hypothetical protein
MNLHELKMSMSKVLLKFLDFYREIDKKPHVLLVFVKREKTRCRGSQG